MRYIVHQAVPYSPPIPTNLQRDYSANASPLITVEHDAGTCHIALVLLSQFHNARELLPESLRPTHYSPTEVATIGDIERGVANSFFCLKSFNGLPSGTAVGKTKGLGVFFWSPTSGISRLYRGHETRGPGLWRDGILNSTVA